MLLFFYYNGNISFGSCSQSEETKLYYTYSLYYSILSAWSFRCSPFFVPPPKNRPVGRLVTFISRGDLPCACVCMSIVPCDDLASHPGCIFASYPVFPGICCGSTTTLTRIKCLLRIFLPLIKLSHRFKEKKKKFTWSDVWFFLLRIWYVVYESKYYK